MKTKIAKITNYDFDCNIKEKQYDGVYVSCDGKNAVIGYGSKVQKMRAYFLLSMNMKKGNTSFEISEKPVFETCGPMIDMSRGGVMKPDAVKDYIDRVAALGLNMLMLYTEDIYEIEGYPKFGYLRGRYTQKELKEIDDYAFETGVELIPCIQTLGHLSNYIKWGEASSFAENLSVLLPGCDKTYDFIESEIKAVRSCFRSNRIHLGMDEAIGLGLGKYLKANGLERPLDIFNNHLKKVLSIAEKYGYEPMIWGDMYFGSENADDYYETDAVIPDYALESAPENTEMVFWDYYHDFYEYYDKKFIQFERFSNKTVFAGGVWTWDGFATNFDYTLRTMEPALKASIDHGIKTVIATMWANGGCETDFFKAFDALCVFSEYYYKGKSCTIDDIYSSAEHISGASREVIDAVSSFHLGRMGADGVGRGLFYCDPLINLLGNGLSYEETTSIYRKSIETINNNPSYKFCRYYSLLFEIADIKADMVLNLQNKYKQGDKEYIKNLADNVIPKLRAMYKEFYKLFCENWHSHYKAMGFEMYASRFGGIDFRLEYAAQKLSDYVSGKISFVEELEEEILHNLRSWKFSSHFMNTCI